MTIAPDPDPRADRRELTHGSIDLPVVLAEALPAAIGRGDIGIRFQPQVRIADGRITGVEALARWDHPLLGPIDADLLFAAADRAGLGRCLSDHVHGAVLAEVGRWPGSLAHLTVSLNVTAADLSDPAFGPALIAAVATAGMEPGRLCLEVTETQPIGDLAQAAGVLRSMRHAGMSVAIDDVGAGYAGFAYLRSLPLDRLKIDKAVIADLADDTQAIKLVRGMIALAAAMNLQVVAEGVETPEQRDRLASEGCGWFQGFLCAGALDATALAMLIEKT